MKKRIICIILASIFWLSSVMLIFRFSSDTAEVSDSLSLRVAQYIEYSIAEHFYVNHNDDFWTKTLNPIVRKCGHFIEFLYLGITTTVLALLLFKRKSLSIVISVIFCVVAAMSDEFRQQFVAGRSGQWSDVLLDSVGSICGILAAGLVYLVHYRIKSLKMRVKELGG
jgi:VanZ family protein